MPEADDGSEDSAIMPPAPPRQPRRHLAEVIAEDLGRRQPPLSVAEIVQRSGLARSTVDVVLHGRKSGSYTPRTLAGIERALGWADGSCERVMSGGKPRRLVDPGRRELLEIYDRLDEQARRMVLHVARSALPPTR